MNKLIMRITRKRFYPYRQLNSHFITKTLHRINLQMFPEVFMITQNICIIEHCSNIEINSSHKVRLKQEGLFK